MNYLQIILKFQISFQVICGGLLILDHTLDLKSEKGLKKCRIINSVIQILMLLIIVLNILVVGLGRSSLKSKFHHQRGDHVCDS